MSWPVWNLEERREVWMCTKKEGRESADLTRMVIEKEPERNLVMGRELNLPPLPRYWVGFSLLKGGRDMETLPLTGQ